MRMRSLGLVALLVPVAAHAQAQYRIGISGEVPVICRVEVVLDVAGDGTGRIDEFCNAARGYDVFVDASPAAAGTVLSVDGNMVTLAAADPTAVSSSDGPASRSRTVLIRHPEGVTGGVLAVRIVPRS